MAFVPGRKTRDLLMWMLSTKMMPAVAVMIPLYLLFQQLGLIDTKIGLVIALMLMNLPIIIWMLYTYFKEIPGEILEASRMDGATLWGEIIYVLTPMALPGMVGTAVERDSVRVRGCRRTTLPSATAAFEASLAAA